MHAFSHALQSLVTGKGTSGDGFWDAEHGEDDSLESALTSTSSSYQSSVESGLQDDVWTVKKILRDPKGKSTIYVTGIDQRPDHDLYICSEEASVLDALRQHTQDPKSPLAGLHNRRTPLYLRSVDVEPMYAVSLALVMQTQRHLGGAAAVTKTDRGGGEVVEIDMRDTASHNRGTMTGAESFAAASTAQQHKIFYETTRVPRDRPSPIVSLAVSHHLTPDQARSVARQLPQDASETTGTEESISDYQPSALQATVQQQQQSAPSSSTKRPRRRIPLPQHVTQGRGAPSSTVRAALVDSEDDEADFALEEEDSSESDEAVEVMGLILGNRTYRDKNLAVRTTPSVAHDVVKTYQKYHPDAALEDAVQWYATNVLEKRWYCINAFYAILHTQSRALGFAPLSYPNSDPDATAPHANQ